jgi:hypothetical protein
VRWLPALGSGNGGTTGAVHWGCTDGELWAGGGAGRRALGTPGRGCKVEAGSRRDELSVARLTEEWSG